MKMDKDFVLQMANTIKDQLVGMTPLNVICSWGIEKFVATEYKGMAALKFHVRKIRGYGIQGHGRPQIPCERTAVPWQCHHRLQ